MVHRFLKVLMIVLPTFSYYQQILITAWKVVLAEQREQILSLTIWLHIGQNLNHFTIGKPSTLIYQLNS
jgi:hypothetical protein